MSLKWSDPSDIQIGPSVNVNPVAICSTSAFSSTSSRSFSDFRATGIGFSFSPAPGTERR